MFTHLGFTGQCLEPEFDVYIQGSRIYSPAVRRFLSADSASPWGVGGLNRYTYCGGDPVCRVDPSGHSWLDWLLSGVGIAAAIGGLVATLLAVPTAGASMIAMVGFVGAAVVDTVSVAAEIGSVVAGVRGNDSLQAAFGWVALGAGVASAGMGVGSKVVGKAAKAAARRAGANVRDVVSPVRVGQSRVTSANDVLPSVAQGRIVLGGADIPPARITAVEVGKGKWETRIVPEWRKFEDPSRLPGVVHWGADTDVSGRFITAALPDMVRGTPLDETVYLYTGAHGSERGRNWTFSERRFSEVLFSQIDHRSRVKLENAIDNRLLFIDDLAVGNPSEALLLWQRPGTHVHAYCYGAVDDLLLTMFNAPPIPVYVL